MPTPLCRCRLRALARAAAVLSGGKKMGFLSGGKKIVVGSKDEEKEGAEPEPEPAPSGDGEGEPPPADDADKKKAKEKKEKKSKKKKKDADEAEALANADADGGADADAEPTRPTTPVRPKLGHKYSHECKDLCAWFLFITVYLLHVWVARASATPYFVTEALEQRLVGNEYFPKLDFSETSNSDQLFQWMDKILLPQLYPTHRYNGRALSLEQRHYMDDLIAVRLGSVRVRQLRVGKKTCAPPEKMKNAFSRCFAPWRVSAMTEEEAKRYHGEKYYSSQEMPTSVSGVRDPAVGMPGWYSLEVRARPRASDRATARPRAPPRARTLSLIHI